GEIMTAPGRAEPRKRPDSERSESGRSRGSARHAARLPLTFPPRHTPPPRPTSPHPPGSSAPRASAPKMPPLHPRCATWCQGVAMSTQGGTVSRRDFMRAGAVGGFSLGGLLGLGTDLRAAQAEVRTLKIADAKEVPSVCPYCAVGCGQLVSVRD